MGKTLFLGTRKGSILLERQADARWSILRQAHLGTPVSYAMRDSRHGTLWACLDHGHWGQKLQRSDDNGESWLEVERPKYPEGAEKGPAIYELFGAEGINEKARELRQPATLSYMWTMAEGGDDKPDRLYIGTEPGGLFVSDDRGESWQLNQALWNREARLTHWSGGGRDFPAIHSILVDPRDSNHLYVALSCAGVFESKDGGESWEVRNQGMHTGDYPSFHEEGGFDPHLIALCQANPDVLWQQNHFGIFTSRDGAANWTEVTQPDGPAKFGFPIAVDAKNPDVAWVVPAQSDGNRAVISGKVRVCRTDDGGKNWKEFTTGLPQENAYDIVYRHALDVDGDTLAFASTTGNLYVSEDRGESWQCVGNNFPPVYSVRFA